MSSEVTLIVDAHAHVFPRVRGRVGRGETRGLGYGRIGVGEEEMQLMPPYAEQTCFTAEMLLANMDWAGVGKAVLLQGPFYGACNEYALAALERFPGRLCAAAFFDPWAESRRNFEGLGEGFRALKLECSEPTGLCGLHPEARLDEPALGWLWAEVEKRGWVLVLDLGAPGTRSYQTGAVRAIARAHPGLCVVVAHLGQPRPSVEADPRLWGMWQEQIDLGLLANVFFDTSALPAYLPEEEYPFPSAGRYLRLAAGRIGAGKLLWGTDQPGLLGRANYPQLVRLARRHTEFLSPAEQALVLGGNAVEVYGLGAG